MQRSLSRDTPRRNAHQAHSPINHRLKQTTFFRESCQGPMALMGRKVPPHARGIFLPSGAGGWEDRGSQPTPGPFPRSQPPPGPSPGCPGHHLGDAPAGCMTPPIPASRGPNQCHPVLSNGGQQGPAQEERQEVLGRGHHTNPLEGGRGREVPASGEVLLRRSPAGRTGSVLCAPQFV